jgi:hypothetical protein
MNEFYASSLSPWRRMWMRMAATGAVVALAAGQTAAAHERPTATVLGRVKTSARQTGPLMVIAIDRDTNQIAHRAFLEAKRAFAIPLHSGRYKFFACSDDNRDGLCNQAETTSVMYALAERVNAGEVIELPTFILQSDRRLASAR